MPGEDNSNLDPENIEDPLTDEDLSNLDRLTNSINEQEAEARAGLREAAQALQGAAQNAPSGLAASASLPPGGAIAIDVNVQNQAGPGQQQAAQALNQAGNVQAQQVNGMGQNAADAGRQAYCSTTCNIVSGVGSLLTMIALVITWSKSARLADLKTAGSHALDHNLGSDIEKIIAYWKGPSEAYFWQKLASFADVAGPRPYQEQLTYMQYTTLFSNHLLPRGFTWNQPSDKLDMVSTFAKDIQNLGISTVYRNLATLTYGPNNGDVPRGVKAEVMSLALTQWYANYA